MNAKLAYQVVGGREFSHPDLIKQLLSLIKGEMLVVRRQNRPEGFTYIHDPMIKTHP